MNKIQSRCIECKLLMQVDEIHAGRTARCPRCGALYTVPVPIDSDRPSTPCDYCGAPTWARTEDVGGSVACDECQQSIEQNETDLRREEARRASSGWGCLIVALTTFGLPVLIRLLAALGNAFGN